jgi:ADP-heptose:LPS heptosyltransferase
MQQAERQRRILVTALGDIDDSLSATPAIRALRHAYPSAYLAVLVMEHMASQWQANPYVNQVLTLRDRRSSGLRGLTERADRALRLLPRIRGRFDTVLMLSGSANEAVVAALSGARNRIGFANARFGFLFTQAVTVPEDATPREANFAMLERLGIEVHDPRMEVFISTRDVASAAGLVARLTGGGSGSLVVLHPGSDWGCQMWDTRRWAEVADVLIERWHARVLITGTEAERPLAQDIAGLMRHEPGLAAGMTSLAELIAIIECADLYVGVNSGPATLAVATRTPTVVLSPLYYAFERPTWGRLPGDSVATEIAARDTGDFRWYGEQRLKMLKRERRCVNPACIGRGVMGTISTETVLTAIEQHLGPGTAELQISDHSIGKRDPA